MKFANTLPDSQGCRRRGVRRPTPILLVLGLGGSIVIFAACRMNNRVPPAGMTERGRVTPTVEAAQPAAPPASPGDRPASTASAAADGLVNREAAKMAAEDQQRAADALQGSYMPLRMRDRYRDNPMLTRRRW